MEKQIPQCLQSRVWCRRCRRDQQESFIQPRNPRLFLAGVGSGIPSCPWLWRTMRGRGGEKAFLGHGFHLLGASRTMAGKGREAAPGKHRWSRTMGMPRVHGHVPEERGREGMKGRLFPFLPALKIHLFPPKPALRHPSWKRGGISSSPAPLLPLIWNLG